MFKSLLRTIPSVSGNFTLACRLNDIAKRTDKEYTALQIPYLFPSVRPSDSAYEENPDFSCKLLRYNNFNSINSTTVATIAAMTKLIIANVINVFF